MESVQGIITRIFKHEDDRIFALIRYEQAGRLVTARMGGRPYGGLREGDVFLGTGKWRTTEYRGRKEDVLNAYRLRPCNPSSRNLIKTHMATIFTVEEHGIGWEAIYDFVNKHGDQSLEAIDANPELLVRLSSKPSLFRQKILDDYEERSRGRRTTYLLSDAGLDEQQIGKILDAFKNEVMEIIRANPYETASVPDIGGFPTADRIGKKMGVASNDRRRIDAALEHMLRIAQDQGSTHIDLIDTMKSLSGKMGLTTEDIQEYASRITLSAPRIVCDIVDNVPVVSLGRLANYEANVAHSVCELLKRPARAEQDVSQRAQKIFAEAEKPFDEIQRRAIIEAARHPFFILTGGPGTGKSTVMRAVADLCEAMGDNVIWLAAPTGKASRRLAETTNRKAQTLHSLLHARRDERHGGSIFGLNRDKTLPPNSVIFVDETSMNDLEISSALFDALPPDGRIIFIGDQHQLPSVGAGQVLSDLLNAQVNGRYIVPSVELKEVYRTASNSKLALDAFKIRDGEVPEVTAEAQGGVSFLETDPHAITPKIIELVQTVLKNPILLDGPDKPPTQLDLLRDVVVLSPQAPGVGGTHEINAAMSRLLNPDGAPIPGVQHTPGMDKRIPLPRVGDRVMLTEENDKKRDLANGDTGRITGVATRQGVRGGPHFMTIEFDNGQTVEYPTSRWKRFLLAYAMTTHKSQGSQYPVVIMPQTMGHHHMLDRTLLYTGWTRAEKLMIAVGEKEALRTAVESQRLTRRSTRTRLLLENRVEANDIMPQGDLVPQKTAKKVTSKEAPKAAAKTDAPMPVTSPFMQNSAHRAAEKEQPRGISKKQAKPSPRAKWGGGGTISPFASPFAAGNAPGARTTETKVEQTARNIPVARPRKSQKSAPAANLHYSPFAFKRS